MPVSDKAFKQVLIHALRPELASSNGYWRCITWMPTKNLQVGNTVTVVTTLGEYAGQIVEVYGIVQYTCPKCRHLVPEYVTKCSCEERKQVKTEKSSHE